MRVLFGTDGIRGIANKEPMTVRTVAEIGKVIGLYFGKINKKTQFLIGKDTRISGDMLENALISGIVSTGMNVIKIGIAPTSENYLINEMPALRISWSGNLEFSIIGIFTEPQI